MKSIKRRCDECNRYEGHDMSCPHWEPLPLSDDLAQDVADYLWGEVFRDQLDGWALVPEDEIADWVAKDLRECRLCQQHPNGVSEALAPALSKFLVEFLVRAGLPEAVAVYLHRWIAEQTINEVEVSLSSLPEARDAA